MIKEQKIIVISGIYDYINKSSRELNHEVIQKNLKDGWIIKDIQPFINGSSTSSLTILLEKEKISNL